ncbi:MAG: hypothetical protein IMF17_07055 [Proteobacteria bacterium]|nr:hypothetical protein [Pseudomonadota bacterium]
MKTFNEKLIQINKKIVLTQVIGTPGAILLGLGIYGMFGANGDAFHPLLNDEIFVKNILIIGAAIEIWQFYVLIPLFKKRSEIMQKDNTP